MLDRTSETLAPWARGLGHMLGILAQECGDQVASRFLDANLAVVDERTYRGLFARAAALAHVLKGRFESGARVLLPFRAGLQFLDAFCACQLAGMVALPLEAVRKGRNERLLNVAADCAAAGAIVGATDAGVISDYLAHTTIPVLVLEEYQVADAAHSVDGLCDGAAYLQYTSGSTSQPRGVVVAPSNVIANCEMMRAHFPYSSTDVFLTWLPHFHDMGLVGKLCVSAYSRATLLWMSASDFVHQPRQWFRAAEKFGATVIGAPNFAYELAIRAQSTEIAGPSLNQLSCAYCGAEPVRASRMASLAAVIGWAGAGHRTPCPCYGLAEATLCVSFNSRTDLMRTARPAGAGQVEAVGCGRIMPRSKVAVVDPATCRVLAPGHVGEIWVHGPHVSAGYWGRTDEENASTFRARTPDDPARGYLRTGDLGFIDGEELFITGRIKDVINIGGRKVHPSDIEATVEARCDIIPPGGCAAISVHDGHGLTERLAVVFEPTRTRRREPLEPVMSALRAAVLAEHDTQVEAVIAVKPGSLPKTSSGKIQRGLLRSLNERSAIEVLSQTRGGSGRAALSEETVRGAVAAATGRADALTVNSDTRLDSLGLDSLGRVRLVLELEQRLGRTLGAEAGAAATLADLQAKCRELPDAPAAAPIRAIRDGSAVRMAFNVMPGREVEEVFRLREYRVWHRYAEATFDRAYQSAMEASPDHVVFLTALAHTQKMVYITLAEEFGCPYTPDAPERFKFWPDDVRVLMPRLETDTTARQRLWVTSLRRTAADRLRCTVVSRVGSLEIQCTAAIILLDPALAGAITAEAPQ